MANEELQANAAPECKLCGGTGWKMAPGEDALGRKVQKATRCDCRLRQLGGVLLEQARLPKRYEHCEFDSFEHMGSFKSLNKAFVDAKKFVEEYPIEQKGLMLIGPIGVGKTHLAVSILKQLIFDKRIPCLFYDYRDLLKQIQNSYNDSVMVTEMDVLRPVFEAEVLVLDELGASKPTEWVWDTVSHILNTRYNDNKTTIVTTNYPNLPPAGSETDRSTVQARASREETLGDRIGERMRSRLHEMCRLVEVTGQDFRLRISSKA